MNPAQKCLHEIPRGYRYFVIFYFLAGSLIFITPLHAQSDQGLHLTEEETIERVIRQPVLQAWMEGRLDEAQSEIVALSHWDNPAFSYALEAPKQRNRNPTEQFFIISQNIDLSGRRGLQQQAARQRLGSVVANTQSQLAELLAETRQRFFDVLFRQQRLEAIEKWKHRLTELEQVIRKRESAGDVSSYDLRRLMREHASAQAQGQAERAHLQHSAERLQSLWEKKETLSGGLHVSGVLLPPEPVSLEQLLAALERNPALRSLAQQKSAFELNAKAADRWKIPKFNLGLGAKTFEAPNSSDTGLVVTFSVPLPLWSQNQAERMRYRAQAQIIDSEYRLANQKASGEIRALWKKATGMIRAAQTFKDRAQSVSDELIHIAFAAYHGGEIGIFELLDAYREQQTFELEALELARKARDATINLDRLTAEIKP